jgi:hypothetical protein
MAIDSTKKLESDLHECIPRKRIRLIVLSEQASNTSLLPLVPGLKSSSSSSPSTDGAVGGAFVVPNRLVDQPSSLHGRAYDGLFPDWWTFPLWVAFRG